MEGGAAGKEGEGEEVMEGYLHSVVKEFRRQNRARIEKEKKNEMLMSRLGAEHHPN